MTTSARNLLIALAIAILGFGAIWYFDNPDQPIDWATNPDSIEVADGYRPQHYRPLLTGIVVGGDTTYAVNPPTGFMEQAEADTMTVCIDSYGLGVTRYYLPRTFLDVFGDSLLRGGILMVRVFDTGDGLAFMVER